MNAYTEQHIKLVNERFDSELAYAKKMLASWEWNAANTSLPEAKIHCDYYRHMIEVVLPEMRAKALEDSQ